MEKKVFGKGVILFAAFFFLTACEPVVNEVPLPTGAGSSSVDKFSSETASDNYKLRPNDVIMFKIQDEPDNRGELKVAEDGKISLSFLGSIFVANCSMSEAEKKIRELYIEKQIYKNPQVSIQLLKPAERKVYVTGYVNRPGIVLIPPEEELTLRKAIANVSGFQARGSRSNVKLTREENGISRTWIIDYRRIEDGLDMDIPLKENDQIVVEDSKI